MAPRTQRINNKKFISANSVTSAIKLLDDDRGVAGHYDIRFDRFGDY
jgi:hypothetical protein